MLPLPARCVTDSAAELIGSIKRQEMVINVALKCYFTRPEHTISCPTRQGCARRKISNRISPPDRGRRVHAALQGRLGHLATPHKRRLLRCNHVVVVKDTRTRREATFLKLQ